MLIKFFHVEGGTNLVEVVDTQLSVQHPDLSWGQEGHRNRPHFTQRFLAPAGGRARAEPNAIEMVAETSTTLTLGGPADFGVSPSRLSSVRKLHALPLAKGTSMKERFFTVILSVAMTWGWVQRDGAPPEPRELTVDRLIVRKELIVSDTGKPWEAGFEEHQIPRGLYARTLDGGVAGLWVRSRLIKAEVDDPFDDRFHALERDGSLRQAPGHISWNIWLDGAWRQMAIVQGEGLELTEVPREQWNGGTHPGRIRFQTYRPGHGEPLTDAVLGQGKMSIGGGGFGGGGLPYPEHVLELWGGTLVPHPLTTPTPPRVVSATAGTVARYAIVAISPEGIRSAPSAAVQAAGDVALEWDSIPGADSYLVLRDGKPVGPALRIEGSVKRWTED